MSKKQVKELRRKYRIVTVLLEMLKLKEFTYFTKDIYEIICSTD